MQTHSLLLIVEHDALLHFGGLMQAGIRIPFQNQQTVGRFLLNLPGFDVEYLTNRVQTIFFNGSAVDDLEQTLTTGNHTIALSAALPGLAGAIFRRNSLCATLRTAAGKMDNSISATEGGEVLLKLFNFVAREKGADILQQGGNFSGKTLGDFLTRHDFLLAKIHLLLLDNTAVAADELITYLQPESYYTLQINTTATTTTETE